MKNKDILSNNKIIAEFMGYIYIEPNVLIEDEYDMYQRYTVYSKTPILVDKFEPDEYDEIGQKYFSDLPNPDFGKEKPTKWNNEIEKLSWASLNSGYLTNEDIEKYQTLWDWIIPVVEKIESLGYIVNIGDSVNKHADDIHLNKPNTCIITENHFKINKLKSHISIQWNKASKLEAVYSAVVEFIEFYNRQK